MKKIILFMIILSIIVFPACKKSNKETKLDSVDSNNVDSEQPKKELLIKLANQEHHTTRKPC